MKKTNTLKLDKTNRKKKAQEKTQETETTCLNTQESRQNTKVEAIICMQTHAGHVLAALVSSSYEICSC